MRDKNKPSPYKGMKKRLYRKKKHIEKADFERMMFEIKKNKNINVWIRPDLVKNDHTPTKYFVVEFNLKEPMILKDFEEMVIHEMGLLI